MRKIHFLLSLFAGLLGQFGHAEDTTYTFSDVQRVLNARCVLCHNNQLALGRLKGGLNLANYDDIQRVVIPGHPIKSAVFTFANTGYMPAGERPRLSERDKDIIYFWIYNGASHDRRREATWQWINQNIIATQCAACHREDGGAKPALDFGSNDNYRNLQPFFEDRFSPIISGQASSHPPITLTTEDQALIHNWLKAGAVNEQIPQATWPWINKNIIQKQCRVCHNDQLLELETYEQVMELVIPGNPTDSPLFGAVESGFMPQDIPLLQSEIDVIYRWILDGAKRD